MKLKSNLIKIMLISFLFILVISPIKSISIKNQLVSDSNINELINYHQPDQWVMNQRQLNVEEIHYDYVIISTNDIVANSLILADFINHKENIGYSVYVATEDDYEQVIGQPPNGRADKIRQWLIDNYIDMGIKYVLLIGNPDPDHPVNPRDSIGDIPMKTCLEAWDPDNPLYTLALLKRDYPTDYYYADLNGNWDFDGDTMYGEYLDDYLYGEGMGVNFTPEVFVGRIPVYDDNYNDLDHILQKTIDYETASEDLDYRKKVLLPMPFVKIWYDHARLGEQIVNDILIPNNFSYWRMYQQGSAFRFLDSQYQSEEELRDGKVKERWSKENFGIVCWAGHGDATQSYIRTGTFFSDGILFSRDDCQYLDDTHPAFTFQISCFNGQPEIPNNLGYSLLTHGAIATVSASRPTSLRYEEPEDFIESFSSGGIAYDYVKHLVEGYSAGEALYLSKMSPLPTEPIQGGIENIYCYNLYGDPSLHLFH